MTRRHNQFADEHRFQYHACSTDHSTCALPWEFLIRVKTTTHRISSETASAAQIPCKPNNLDASGPFLREVVANVLAKGMPAGVDVLKLDVPENATPATPWRWTRLSRQRYYYPVAPKRLSLEHALPMGFVIRADPATVEPDSDICAVAIDRVVSLCPLSSDLTARTAAAELWAWG